MECGSAFATGLIGAIVYQGGGRGGTRFSGQVWLGVWCMENTWK